MSSVFLAGETIDLCVPTEEDFDIWAGWFNDQKITQFLEQGKYPNTPIQQRAFYQQAVQEGRFLTLIKSKESELLGVVSLSEINNEKRSCQIACVCPVKAKKAQLAPIEAMAICSQHAFLRFGMTRVWGGQAFPGLKSWSQKLELIGYKADGIVPGGFKHGAMVSDALLISITRSRFLRLQEQRGGALWPGEEKINKMLLVIKKHRPLAEEVDELLKNVHLANDEFIDNLEKNVD